MIRFGVCGGVDKLQTAAEAGFDYLETGLAAIAAMQEDAFEAVVREVEEAPIAVEAFNGMMPGDIALTGPTVNTDAIRAYLDIAFARAARLHGRVIVFGSGKARRVPEGFPMEEGMGQLVEFLCMCVPYCKQTGIVIAIEPLRKAETNIIHTVSDGLALALRVDTPEIGVLGDTFHMYNEQEPLSALTDAGAKLYHVHIAEPRERVCPFPGDGCDYGAIIDALRAGGYDGRVSIEGRVDDMAKDGGAAARMLKALWQG